MLESSQSVPAASGVEVHVVALFALHPLNAQSFGMSAGHRLESATARHVPPTHCPSHSVVDRLKSGLHAVPSTATSIAQLVPLHVRPQSPAARALPPHTLPLFSPLAAAVQVALNEPKRLVESVQTPSHSVLAPRSPSGSQGAPI